ncbi:hypothetical protein CK203_064324 [Vitis vinifera]|uniref:Reverse transcriptase RNase H-like domain-containing protein n=1 Tax=Vitis vinifera TaxID=29760 RepID=A0A438G505_VITVI|nr:hypothetical protein CK203_064324 [Vitis vinifera]
MALNLRIAAKKLCPYFQAHQITVLTNQPLWVTLHKLNLSSRMVNWAIKLSEYYIRSNNEEQWRVLHVDEASRTSEARIGLTQQFLTGEQIEQVVCLNFPVSNIEAKYEAILMRRSSLSSHNHEKKLNEWFIKRVPLEENEQADALAEEYLGVDREATWLLCQYVSHQTVFGTMIDGGEHPTMPLILAIESS